jgi:hypothetical protein
VYHGIISQMVIDMFIYAFRIPYVCNGDHTDAVRMYETVKREWADFWLNGGRYHAF